MNSRNTVYAWTTLLFIILEACVPTHAVQPTELTPIRYGSVPAIVEAPAHVAYDRGLFRQQGLDLTIEINPDGKTSLDHLLDGQIDLVAVMGTPVVYRSFERNDLRIIGTIEHRKIHCAVARKDRQINEPDDLRGKKIAVTLGTSGHYFLDSFLLIHGISPSDIEIVDMTAPESVDAFIEGSIDAIFTWSPFPLLAQQQLGDQAVVIDSERLVPASWVIVTTDDYANGHFDELVRFLRALNQGLEFIEQDRTAAIASYARVSGLEPEIAQALFEDMSYDLTLEQNLLLDLENQARWLIAYGYTDQTQVPNYLDLIVPGPLAQIRPEQVTIIK